MLVAFILIVVSVFFIWIGIILQRAFADFLSFFLLAYLTRFGYSRVNGIEELSQIISALVVLWLAYVLWKDFGKERLHSMLKTLHH